jgi:hypothetical protein
MLNRLLALLFRGQVQINIWPLPTALAQEPLKEKLHPNRIDCCNFQCVTDRGVRSATAPLNKDVVPLAEANDIPDDEEISRKAELCDQGKLMLDLLLGTLQKTCIALRSVASSDPFLSPLLEEAVHRLAIWDWIAWKFISEIA